MSISPYSLLNSHSFGSNNWCFKFQPLDKANGLLLSLSNGEIHCLDFGTCQSKQSIRVSNLSINDLKILNSDFHCGSLFSTATAESVKIFDINSNNGPIATLHNDKNVPFLSLDSRHGLLAMGTELQGVDAQINIYDIRKWDTPLRSLIDSHHDDVTALKFHPSDPTVLLSGSTDGYTNVYDLTQQDEDDALHQVMNYASIHSCGWLSPNRIFTLSHMETFAIHELNDKSEELKEPQPLDFGDVREKWGCDYVIDVYPGYIAAGKSQEGNGQLKLIPTNGENISVKDSVVIPSAHGDEVIRDVFIPPSHSELVYSCGEDGFVNLWKNNNGALNVPEQFWDYSKRTMHVLDGDFSLESGNEVEKSKLGVEKREKSKKSKSKKSKKKEKKHSKSQRFKPY
ncbi:uncharacterized protein NDAI_0G00630 [Naumovozyma dairenensis CBS 421]|uniref:Uncharacterized protein n=1 Tax=Naumovozyma dairenensis (strain ATCC 10597 / BCRC 20456 / CBS 421 / NBRC 0211 / NRRL Y-12639) TaxID=1071378 RepID=G0WDH8_NAUDC|nr:hypothetical protein NDAI_0G00630 [Naumovozyma dairenensis CBS 421]CCD25839.2 hypothetical protein NDAI_0G00630 [Naumovozyma dairenensis CBS 421]